MDALTADPFFGPPRIHRDEWYGAPLRHRRVRGCFEGTDTRFCFCFPEPGRYEGRFIQFLGGGLGGDERQGVVIGMHGLAFDEGAYYVESNQGHVGQDLSGLRGDMSILGYRASAQSARFARELAAEMYGGPPHHGYVIGPSGGAMRAVECLERVPELWHGAVPWMINRVPLHQFHWSLSAWAGAVLGAQLPAVVDARSPGGSGDPSAALSPAQRHALEALEHGGLPHGTEAQLEPNPLWLLGMRETRLADPDYFRAFWHEPGYAGADHASGLRAVLVEHQVEVGEVVSAAELSALGEARDLQAVVLARTAGSHPVGIRLRGSPPDAELTGACLSFRSGARAGQRVDCSGSLSGVLLAAFDPHGFSDVRPGDQILIDNRDVLAFRFYHRHLVDRRYPGMRQFFDGDRPRHPRRPVDFDRLPTPSGRFAGKMILVQHTHDRECWPVCAQAYADDVRAALGDATDDAFRLYWIEHAAHLVPLTPETRARLIDHRGIPAQATRDLIAWVERGRPPLPSTRASYDAAQLSLPTSASERSGIQPVVSARANGGTCVRVRVGEVVRLSGRAEVPEGAGGLVRAEWDLHGRGDFEVADVLEGTPREHASAVEHRYAEPGTYFPCLRVASERPEAGRESHRIENLARVRVVVC